MLAYPLYKEKGEIFKFSIALKFAGILDFLELGLFPLPGNLDEAWIFSEWALTSMRSVNVHSEKFAIRQIHGNGGRANWTVVRSYAQKSSPHDRLLVRVDEVGGLKKSI